MNPRRTGGLTGFQSMSILPQAREADPQRREARPAFVAYIYPAAMEDTDMISTSPLMDDDWRARALAPRPRPKDVIKKKPTSHPIPAMLVVLLPVE